MKFLHIIFMFCHFMSILCTASLKKVVQIFEFDYIFNVSSLEPLRPQSLKKSF